ncbi:hypothetical protein O0L34_g4330 [Tuta absoluta]|nr:hypothetical protein O0L34_g4330 [Tuta absoluta]
MRKSPRNIYPFLRVSVYCLTIYFLKQTTASKSESGILVNTNTVRETTQDVLVPANPTTSLSRQKRQLFLPRLSSRSRLTQSLTSPLNPLRLRLPPRQPIVLPIVTSAISDRIRTYPQYFQEIPLALGETIMDTVREAAPHFTQALKEISPGIMEIVNVFPEAENITPIQKIMKKIPTVLHESMQAALSSEEDYAETAPIYNVQSIEEDWTMTSRRDKPTNTILGKIEETSTNFKDTLMQKGKTAFDTLEETSMNLQEKINSKLEETKQKAQHLFNNLFEATEDFYPKRASTHYSPKKTSKKASSASNTISPEIRDSLSEMASLPQKIKKLVQQMQR